MESLESKRHGVAIHVKTNRYQDFNFYRNVEAVVVLENVQIRIPVVRVIIQATQLGQPVSFVSLIALSYDLIVTF